ncbi:hypothetical protein ESY87_19955 [Subsaximicrobium wynnwilliamsii]|uniref:hypothetical protein n=1 Tax=Subsaximicrobium wynnwilliamsii TaxID=291179 RepID=UPI0011BE7A30|nr:hypothetical protein [Subsaximicrobium wynnwilliamsii]TXD80865.1 hypothetical protein ESY87_19955 [Subsaximicrobium wynnwilliamsii]TXE00150.1 hypothetical protein ESY88_19915 [Subsaximicrobium wynnwilliamsii]
MTFFTLMTKLSAQECEYSEYYPLVELASKYYSQKNYKESEINFKLAFDKTEFPLGKDLHLAFLIAEKIKDAEWALQIATQLAKGGVPLSYFRYYKKTQWYSQLNAEYKTYSDYYITNFKPELRDKFNSLIERDATFTRQIMDWYYGTIEITSENAYNEANAIYSELKQMTEKYGFPSEHNMGYNYVSRLNKIEDYHTLALMIHIYKYGERIYENEIPNYICSGILHPNSKQILKQSMGFGNSMGIEHEMKVREEMYKKKKE